MPDNEIYSGLCTVQIQDSYNLPDYDPITAEHQGEKGPWRHVYIYWTRDLDQDKRYWMLEAYEWNNHTCLEISVGRITSQYIIYLPQAKFIPEV